MQGKMLTQAQNLQIRGILDLKIVNNDSESTIGDESYESFFNFDEFSTPQVKLKRLK